MSTIPFTKMHGAGNDYVYLDAIADPALGERDDFAALSRAMSDRHCGIGADGLIVVMKPDAQSGAHVRMRMFNADGSESEMCGNGIRCVAKLAHDRGHCQKQPMRVDTGAGVLSIEYETDSRHLISSVTVDMGKPILEPANIPVEFPQPQSKPIIDFPLDTYIPINAPAAWMEECGLDPRMTCLSMGNPHVVIYCNSPGAVSLETIGPFFECQNIFPNRINVHFVRVENDSEVTMRTWERGSGITQACGTGACAVCVAGVLTGRTERGILAHLPGGDLVLQWNEQSDHVHMTGPATEVFRGEWKTWKET